MTIATTHNIIVDLAPYVLKTKDQKIFQHAKRKIRFISLSLEYTPFFELVNELVICVLVTTFCFRRLRSNDESKADCDVRIGNLYSFYKRKHLTLEYMPIEVSQ